MHAEIFIPITMFAATFGVLYVFLMTRSKERLAMIEKGADASQFATKRNPGRVLRIGMAAIGVGIGLLVGYLLGAHTELPAELATFSMVFLFGGLALVANYLIIKKQPEN